MESINCIFCNLNSETVIIEENGFQGRKCDNCNLIYISPRPQQSEILDIYGHDNAFLASEVHISDEYRKRLYAQYYISILKKYRRSGSLLEIGSGAGYFLDQARSEGYEVYSIELNPKQADFIRNGLNIPCETSPLNDTTFAGKKFDIIYFCDVLSHFYYPFEEVEKIREHLKDNGICVFETGNFADVDSKYLKKIGYFHYPDHLFFFGNQSIRQLFEQKSGFTLIAFYNYSILPEIYIDRMFSKGMRFAAHLIKRLTFASNGSIPPRGKASEIQQSQIDLPGMAQKKRSFLVKKTVRNAINKLRDFSIYIARYKIGAWVPTQGRPQTIICVAEKTDIPSDY